MPLNDVIWNHEITLDWDHKRLSGVLGQVFEVCNKECFAGALPRPLLRYERMSRKTRMRYRHGVNGIAAPYEITVNIRYFHAPLSETLGMFVHMLIHQFEELNGRTTSRNYHGATFRKMAEDLGIPGEPDCRARCTIVDYCPAFLNLVGSLGYNLNEPTVEGASEDDLLSTSPLKEWRCECSVVHSGKSINMSCNDCGTMLVLQVTEDTHVIAGGRMAQQRGATRELL